MNHPISYGALDVAPGAVDGRRPGLAAAMRAPSDLEPERVVGTDLSPARGTLPWRADQVSAACAGPPFVGSARAAREGACGAAA